MNSDDFPRADGADQLHQRRQHDRYDVTLEARVSQGTAEIGCRTRNVSGGGAALVIDSVALHIIGPGAMRVAIAGLGTFPATRRWSSGTTIGLRFDIPPARKSDLARRLAARFGTQPQDPPPRGIA